MYNNIDIDFTNIKLNDLVFNFGDEKFMPEFNKSYTLKTYDGIRYYPKEIISYWYIIRFNNIKYNIQSNNIKYNIQSNNLEDQLCINELNIIKDFYNNDQKYLNMINKDNICVFTTLGKDSEVLQKSIYLQGILKNK